MRQGPSWPIVLLTLCSWNSLLAILLGKDLNWDLLNYRFYNPYAFLTGRHELDVIPAQIQTFLNPLLDIPLYLALTTLPPVVVGAIYGFVQGLNGVAVWLIAREVLPAREIMVRSWAAFGGFWLWELWSRFGNPLFPYFNNVFRSELAPLASMRDVRFLPGSTWHAVFYPLVWTVNPLAVNEHAFRDWRFPLIFVLLVALGIRWCVQGWRRWARLEDPAARPRAFLLAGALASYGLWLLVFGIYRYLATLEWLVPLGLTLALWTLLPRPGRIPVIVAVLVLITVTTQPLRWGRTSWVGSYFGVTPPRIERPNSTMVLMAGFGPLSYLIPHFPPQVRFVRVQSNMHGHEGSRNAFDRLVADAVAAHHGDFYVVFGVEDSSPVVDRALTKLGLHREANSCEAVRPVRVSPVVFCPASRHRLTK